jgi:ABC-2 type transport system ATP-binding protein
MESILKVDGLVKKYGDLTAVNKISFDVKKGEIFALIGPNGAGKTSTLRVVATILKANDGKITINNNDIEQKANDIRQDISYLPEEAGAYKNMKGIQYLKFMAEIFAKDREEADRFIKLATEIADLGDRINNKVSTYSKGMVRKLLLARALMTKPSLAILDEPTSGLDVINALEIRNIIKDFAKEGMSILVSSHNMLEIEYLCNRVAIIHKGELLEIGSSAELKEKYKAQNLEEVFAEVAK